MKQLLYWGLTNIRCHSNKIYSLRSSGTWDLFIPDFSFSTILVLVYLCSSSFNQLLLNCLVVEPFSLLQRLESLFSCSWSRLSSQEQQYTNWAKTRQETYQKEPVDLDWKQSHYLEICFRLITFHFKMILHTLPAKKWDL
jgi:hypothetical protein